MEDETIQTVFDECEMEQDKFKRFKKIEFERIEKEVNYAFGVVQPTKTRCVVHEKYKNEVNHLPEIIGMPGHAVLRE